MTANTAPHFKVMDISASIVQGSAVGPVSYVISASDLSTVTPGNSMHKYADHAYIVISARNAQSREVELDHVTESAQRNNLKLNCANCRSPYKSFSRIAGA